MRSRLHWKVEISVGATTTIFLRSMCAQTTSAPNHKREWQLARGVCGHHARLLLDLWPLGPLAFGNGVLKTARRSPPAIQTLACHTASWGKQGCQGNMHHTWIAVVSIAAGIGSEEGSVFIPRAARRWVWSPRSSRAEPFCCRVWEGQPFLKMS